MSNPNKDALNKNYINEWTGWCCIELTRPVPQGGSGLDQRDLRDRMRIERYQGTVTEHHKNFGEAWVRGRETEYVTQSEVEDRVEQLRKHGWTKVKTHRSDAVALRRHGWTK